MPNLYVPLGATKDVMRITATGFDTRLMRLIEDVCRAADEHCGRKFYDAIATRYYDGNGGASLWIDDDLLTVTSLKVDLDGDGVYETTLTADTDYWLWPDNESPKRRIDLNPRSTQASTFPIGRRRVQIVGVFGFSDETETSGTLGAAITDTTGTSVTMTASHGLTGGETIEVTGSAEQLFVSSVSTNTLTVVRGVNGTTATTHLNAAAVARHRYDRLIERAVTMQVSRFWRDSQSGGAGATGDVGGFTVASMYPAIRDMLDKRAIWNLR